MSTAYQLTGRTHQKARTRAALVAATRELLASGITPTVEQAADRAAISRTTAYRYFVNQRALLAAAYPIIDTSSLMDPAPPEDPIQRLEVVVTRFTEQVVKHEAELRAMLRLSLEPTPPSPDQLPLRQGRGIGWIEEALAPLKDKVPPAALRRLAVAIRAAIGIEAMVWLCDVAHLSRDEALDVMKWSARALLDTALRELDGAPGRRRGAKRSAPRRPAARKPSARPSARRED